MASKVAIDPERPSLGRIRVDSVPPPHTPTSIKRCISRVERIPELARANLFADISCDTQLKEGHSSILRTDGPGLSPNKPMAIVQVESPPISDGKYVIKNRAGDVQMPIVQVESPPISDGKYVIKNRSGDIYWSAYTRHGMSPMTKVRFWQWPTSEKRPGDNGYEKVNKHSLTIQVLKG